MNQVPLGPDAGSCPVASPMNGAYSHALVCGKGWGMSSIPCASQA